MENHAYFRNCNCNYCELRRFLKELWEKREYETDEEKKIAYECAKKHYKLIINNGYKPPQEIPHYIITLSFDPDKELNETDVIDKIKSIKYFQEETAGCFEYFGENGKYHPHAHIVAKYKYINKFNFIKPLAKKLNLQKNFIDVKYGTSSEIHERRMKYISGEKGEAKMEQVKLDQKYRKCHELINSFKIRDNCLTII